MKLQALSAMIAAPIFLIGPMVQDGGQPDIAETVEQQGAEITELRIELTETRDLLNMTLEYLEGQAKAAKSLEGSLGEVEALGFTAGINSDSRTALLRGWRSYLGDQQVGVPKADTPKSKKSR